MGLEDDPENLVGEYWLVGSRSWVRSTAEHILFYLLVLVFLGLLASCNGEPPPPPPPPPTPTPSPTPTPNPLSACPKQLAPEANVFMRNKAYGAGVDSTVYVQDDPEFCQMIHGVPTSRCHLEGWPERTLCEMQILAMFAPVGTALACPHWQFRGSDGEWYPCEDNPAPEGSCDHFGSTAKRDDPQTPTTGDTLETLAGFEGEPKACGLDRGAFGPRAGFFTIAHTSGVELRFRACRPDGMECGRGTPRNH